MMSNDTNTLNGALQELGETMAANITAKGVSASASDGLTTLAGKISQISQGSGGTPVVEFDNTTFGTHFAFTRPNGSYKDTFTVHVPSGVTTLENYCFYYLYNMTDVDLPSSLTTINTYAFSNCQGLTELELPNTVSSIGTYAFYYAIALESINIPTSLTTIPSNCFRYCSSLEEITIPSNVTTIGSYAFGNCSSMEKIRFESATPPSASANAFYNLPTTCVIEVPCDSLSLYTSASNYPSSSTYTYVPYGCNGIKFGSNSYSTNTGSCELSLRLWDNDAPVSGGTITITGSDSSTYTCTTDSNGEATCTVTNVSGTVTFTATYSNYTATCTVTQSQYLFYDDCSVDNTSNWSGSNAYAYWESGPGTAHTLTFDTDHYVFSHSVGSFLGLQLPNLSTSLDNYVLTADILANGTNTDYGGGLGILQDTEKGMGMVQPNSTSGKHTYLYNPTSGRGSVISQTTTSNYVVGDYHTHRLTKQGTTVKYEILHNGTVIFTNTKTSIATNLATQTIPCICVGRWDTAKFKNIKVEAL